MQPCAGALWPAFPPEILAAWEELGGYALPPEACLINYYAFAARMSLHQDRDEADFLDQWREAFPRGR